MIQATQINLTLASVPNEGCELRVDDGWSTRIAVARTSAQQLEGLRNRRDLTGMLFEPPPTTLTMEGVSVPLSAVVLRPEGDHSVVVAKLAMEPEKRLYDLSAWAGFTVLELAVDSSRIEVGSKVRISDCRTW